MRQVTRIPALALVLFTAALPASAGCERLRATDTELWSTGRKSPARIVRDPRGVFAPAWSPEGDRIAYGRNADVGLDVRPEVVMIGARGGSLRTFALPKDSPVNAILNVGWRGSGRVWAEGHVNPSTSMYLEWDVASGRLLDQQAGSRFTVSPDGRSIAWLKNVPHGAPPPHDSATLVIDGKPVWPDDPRYHRIRGKLAWSPDSRRLAFFDDVEEATELVTLKREDVVLSHVRVETEVEPQLLGWLGDTILITGSGEEALRVTATGAIEKTNLPVRDAQRRIDVEPCRPSMR